MAGLINNNYRRPIMKPVAKTKMLKTQTLAETLEPVPQILSRRQLAQYLGVCDRMVANLEKQGVLPSIKLGKRRVYKLDSILTALSRLEKCEPKQP
jgi:hypothetical protein